MLIQYLWVQYTQIETIPYSQFEQLLDQNKISKVLVGSDTIQGTLKDPFPDGRELFSTTRVDLELASKLTAHGVKVTGAPSSNFLLDDSVLGSAHLYLLFDLDLRHPSHGRAPRLWRHTVWDSF
jgi:ATP-dependent Zn protease